MREQRARPFERFVTFLFLTEPATLYLLLLLLILVLVLLLLPLHLLLLLFLHSVSCPSVSSSCVANREIFSSPVSSFALEMRLFSSREDVGNIGCLSFFSGEQMFEAETD